MSKLTTIYRELRPNAAWDVIKAAVWLLGVAMMSTGFVSAVIRLLQETPIDWKIIVGVFLSSLAFMTLAFLIGKWQRKGRKADATTNPQQEQSIRTENIAPVKEPCPEEWAHRIAYHQSQQLRRFVLVESCVVNSSHLLANKLYVDFTFTVSNLSMFSVSVPISEGALVEGSILFKGDPLSGAAKVFKNNVKNLDPTRKNDFTVRQWVNPSEAKDISETLEKSGNLFDFSKATVYVLGDEMPDAKPSKLDLTRGMQNADLENKVIQLEALKSQYEAELEEWNSAALQIERLSMAHGKAQEIYNELNHDRVVPKDKLSFWLLGLENDIRDSLGREALLEFNNGQDTDYRDVPEELHAQERWMSAYLLRVHNLIRRLHRPSNFHAAESRKQ